MLRSGKMRRMSVYAGNIGGLSTALQNAVDKPLMPEEEDVLHGAVRMDSWKRNYRLKNQQGLLVEYSAFPQRFIELLEQCISEQDKTVPRFLLQLQTSSSGLDCMSASLNIIETNPFKHLVHLSLKLLEGNDNDVKKYLADCIQSLKLENCVLKGKLQKSEEDFSQTLCLTQQALDEKCKELNKLRNEWTSHTSLLTSRHTQEITTEREKVLQMQTQYQHKYEQQKKELESSSSRTMQHLESRACELEVLNKDLTERKYKSESCIRELKGKLGAVEEENHRVKQEVASLRRENTTLDSECHDKEKLLNQYKMRSAVLEQEVKDKEEVVVRTTEACDSAREQKKKLEEALEQKRLHTGKLETTVKSLSEELIKANEIIKKLQIDMKKLVDKMKLKNAVTMQQEKLLGEKDQMLQKEKTELADVKHSLKMKEDETLQEESREAERSAGGQTVVAVTECGKQTARDLTDTGMYRHIKRRCSDTDNDPDRCSVAVWSLESCHTDSSPATNDAAAGKQSGDVTAVLSGCPALTARAEKHSAGDRQRKLLKLQEQLDCTSEKLEESKQLLKTNENGKCCKTVLISWLNKQLNENKMASLQGSQASCEMPGLVRTMNPAANMAAVPSSVVRPVCPVSAGSSSSHRPISIAPYAH
ncbi:unnamed protein product [Ranitomeya imitator]|uniref:Spindle assembly abnormal protein 6 homolog n=1 Tax=Ranitomeya imitator TaxID=111125 RepID=A0ABN9M6Q7_9NEOB|nr:unnamed protein product [Ranitomeya imitator]